MVIVPAPRNSSVARALFTSLNDPEKPISPAPAHSAVVYPVGVVNPAVVVIFKVPAVAVTTTFMGSTPATETVVPDEWIALYIVESETLIDVGAVTD